MKSLLFAIGLLAFTSPAMAAEPGCPYDGATVPVGKVVRVSISPAAFKQCVQGSAEAPFFGEVFSASDVWTSMQQQATTPADWAARQHALLAQIALSGIHQELLLTKIYEAQVRDGEAHKP